jgi:hypothetical protein
MDLSALTDSQLSALNEVRRHFHVQHHFLDGWYLNFLRNKDFNVAETVAKLDRRCQMELDEFRNYDVTESMKRSMSTGVLQLLGGKDRDDVPVVYIVTRRDHPRAEERVERRKNMDMWMTYATRLTSTNPYSRVTWLIDQKGSSLWSNTDLTFQREMLTRIAKYYPFSQHRVLVCNMGNGLSFVLKPLIRGAPAAIRDSIVILSESDIQQGKLEAYLDPSVIPVALGGMSDCDHEDQWHSFSQQVTEYTERCVAVLRCGTMDIKTFEMMEAFATDRNGRLVEQHSTSNESVNSDASIIPKMIEAKATRSLMEEVDVHSGLNETMTAPTDEVLRRVEKQWDVARMASVVGRRSTDLSIFWGRLTQLHRLMQDLRSLLHFPRGCTSPFPQSSAGPCCHHIPEHHLRMLHISCHQMTHLFVHLSEMFLVDTVGSSGGGASDEPGAVVISSEDLLSLVLGHADEVKVVRLAALCFSSSLGGLTERLASRRLPMDVHELLDMVHMAAGRAYYSIDRLLAASKEMRLVSARLLHGMWGVGVDLSVMKDQLWSKARHCWEDMIQPLMVAYEDALCSLSVLQFVREEASKQEASRASRSSSSMERRPEEGCIPGGFKNTNYCRRFEALRTHRRRSRTSLLFHFYPPWEVLPETDVVVPSFQRNDYWHMSGLANVKLNGGSSGPTDGVVTSPPGVPPLKTFLGNTACSNYGTAGLVRALCALGELSSRRNDSLASIANVLRQLHGGRFSCSHHSKKFSHWLFSELLPNFDGAEKRFCGAAPYPAGGSESSDAVSLTQMIGTEVSTLTKVVQQLPFPVEEFFIALSAIAFLEAMSDDLPSDDVGMTTAAELLLFQSSTERMWEQVWTPRIQRAQGELASLSSTATTLGSSCGAHARPQHAMSATALSDCRRLVVDDTLVNICFCISWLEQHRMRHSMEPPDPAAPPRNEQEGCHSPASCDSSVVSELMFTIESVKESITSISSWWWAAE